MLPATPLDARPPSLHSRGAWQASAAPSRDESAAAAGSSAVRYLSVTVTEVPETFTDTFVDEQVRWLVGYIDLAISYCVLRIAYWIIRGGVVMVVGDFAVGVAVACSVGNVCVSSRTRWCIVSVPRVGQFLRTVAPRFVVRVIFFCVCGVFGLRWIALLELTVVTAAMHII